MKNYLIIIPVVLIVLSLLVVYLKKRKMKRDNAYQAMRKRQDASLKEAIANPFRTNKDTDETVYRPYKVKYKAGNEKNKKSNLPLLQVNEKSRISEKEYMLKAEDRLLIGNQYGICKIVNETDIKSAFCEITYIDNSYGIRLVDFEKTVILSRNRRKMKLNRDIIRLKTGDIIRADGSVFTVKVVK